MHLTRDQHDKLGDQVGEHLVYFGRLEKHTITVGFRDDDELLRLVRDAYDKVHHLRMAIYYRSCNNVGKHTGNQQGDVP